MRNREPRRFLAGEQALHHRRQQEQQEIARVLRESVATVEPDDSSEDDLPSEEGSSSEDDEKDGAGNETKPLWSRHLHDAHPALYNDPPLVQLPRVRPQTELGYLQCFLDKMMIHTFVDNTNEYAAARQAPGWVEMTTPDMWRSLAQRIRQGTVLLPHLHHYWQDGYRDGYICQLVTRDHFMHIHRYIHIILPVDPGVRVTVVVKTAPLYHQCQRLFKANYTPGCDVALDETMVRFQGRSPWILRGGYDNEPSKLHHVVVTLMEPWADVNRRLFFDNLYTWPALCGHLLQMKIRSCGTCHPNRPGLPKKPKKERKKMPKEKKVAWQRGQLGCLLWNNSKSVIFLSTHHRVDALTAIPFAHGRPATARPIVAVDYNKHKGHFDRVAQLRSYNVIER